MKGTAVGLRSNGERGPLDTWLISGKPLVHRDARFTCPVCRTASFEQNRPHMHCDSQES